MLLAGWALPAPCVAAVHAGADRLVVLASTSVHDAENRVELCRKGEAHAGARYTGSYRIVVGFGGGLRRDYTDYADFAKRGLLFQTKPLERSDSDGGVLRSRPGALLSHGADYLGVYGVTVFDKATGEQLAWYLSDYGMECGAIYGITLADHVNG